MPQLDELQTWRGRDVRDPDGDKIGSIEDIYLDEQTGRPEWLAVKTGLFGSKISFVPVGEATATGDGVQVPYSKAQVKDSPNAEADGALSQSEESQLYAHYGRDYAGGGDAGMDTTTTTTGGGDRGTVGRDVSGPETDDAMTRSEEEISVGTRSQETGRVRLRKYIVTEPVTTTVEVQREEVRLEREPITDANRDAALSGGDLTEEEHEVTLHAEEPVVEKRVVPKERVRLDRETVAERAEVTDEVRKERIETEGDVAGDGR
jgi:uncharacterized protein (TIGR02271 family)